jgi:hypothetical protein
VSDESEIDDVAWMTPSDALSLYAQQRIRMLPPQYYILDVLYRLKSAGRVGAWAAWRDAQPIEAWMPKFAPREEQGDDVSFWLLYPGDVDYVRGESEDVTDHAHDMYHRFLVRATLGKRGINIRGMQRIGPVPATQGLTRDEAAWNSGFSTSKL